MNRAYYNAILKDGWYKDASEQEMKTALANLENEILSGFRHHINNTMNSYIVNIHNKRLDEIYGEGEG